MESPLVTTKEKVLFSFYGFLGGGLVVWLNCYLLLFFKIGLVYVAIGPLAILVLGTWLTHQSARPRLAYVGFGLLILLFTGLLLLLLLAKTISTFQT